MGRLDEEIWSEVMDLLSSNVRYNSHFVGNSLCVELRNKTRLALHLNGRAVFVPSGESIDQPPRVTQKVREVYLSVKGRTPYFRANRAIQDKVQANEYVRACVA